MLTANQTAVNSVHLNLSKDAMNELPIPVLIALACAALSWLVVGLLKQGNDKLRKEIATLARRKN